MDMSQATSSYFQTNDGVRLHYGEVGTGRPLVLIHGWSGSSAVFKNNVPNLCEGFRTIWLDLRGHGESGKPRYGLRVSRLAMDLNNLLDHLNLDKISVVGCSLGSAVIWAFVELFGCRRLSAAVFVDQSPYQQYSFDGQWRLGSNGFFSPGALAFLTTSLQHDPKAFHVSTVEACLTREATTDDFEFFVSEALKAPAWLLAKLMTDHNNNDWRDVLPLVTCPTLVVGGAKTKVFPVEGVVYAASVMPNAEKLVMENGSHWLYYEEPQRFNEELTRFLDQVFSSEVDS